MIWSGRVDKNNKKINLNDKIVAKYEGMGGVWEHYYIVKVDDRGFYFEEESRRVSIDYPNSKHLQVKK